MIAGLFMSYLWDLLFILFLFSAHFHHNPIKIDTLVFEHFVEDLQLFLDDKVDKQSE